MRLKSASVDGMDVAGRFISRRTAREPLHSGNKKTSGVSPTSEVLCSATRDYAVTGSLTGAATFLLKMMPVSSTSTTTVSPILNSPLSSATDSGDST